MPHTWTCSEVADSGMGIVRLACTALRVNLGVSGAERRLTRRPWGLYLKLSG